MMEVEKPWELKEDADVMAAAAEEEGSLLTRGRNKRHTLELNGEEGGEGEGGGEGQEAHEEHKSVFFDPTQVSEHFTEKDGKNEVTQVAQFIALKEKADETSSPKGKELDTQENVNVQETNGDDNISRLEKGSCTNGSHEVSSSGETATVANGTAELKLIAVIDENKRSLANSNGADHIDNGSMNRTNVPEIEAEKEEDTIMGKVNIEEYDLEKILDEQETHELFCPNCNSCITRRVILRKRKRTVRQTTRDEPPKKAQLAEPFANNSNQTVPERHEQESPDIFRCLSCFTFFIPTGCGLNIFRIFGRPEVNQEVQVHGPSASHEMSSSDSCGSWLLSCFEPADNPKKTDADPEKKPLLSDMQDSNGTTSVEASTTYKEDFTASLSESSVEAHSLPAASIVTPGQSETGFKHTAVTDVVTRHRDIVNQERIPLAKPGDAAQLDKQDVERTVTDSRAFTTTEIKFPDARPATLTPVEPEAPPHLPVQTVTDAPMPVVHPASADQRDGWDILKAIVYGGLVESITSLSVVSAAASSGAVTLDIFILGIANLIGGLPIIFHSIADLRTIGDVDESDEQVGHYWVQLGRRSKSRRHVFMAMLSYILFGLLPPVIYGLSFRGGGGGGGGEREKKMVAVVAASLACIALLAVGKAHVKTPPRSRSYVKTVVYYLSIAVSSSGLSYFAGVLITMLLARLGLIDG
ncbi:hypothetical protein GUJ93_ZPchr0012g21686 [Zizania palustris]|uniref:Membrane protein of ER body-like protein n=1 Tax=Zizania palustris TaxID=103762 RepID=A0A8J5WVS2_ZIZPA|nr:hypothetical protein GUJ93_ZPchr0012g21686 [Zizania palustris]